MNTRLLAALAALFLPAWAAPASAQTISYEQMWGSYDPVEIHGARGGRRLPTVVRGNPFDVPDEVLTRAVVAAMRGEPRDAVRPVPPAEAARAPLRVVLLFGGSTSVGDVICDRDRPAPSAAGGGGKVELIATYCRGDRPMTQVMGRLSGASGPDDPKFHDFIRQVSTVLFPPSNPDMRGDPFVD